MSTLENSNSSYQERRPEYVRYTERLEALFKDLLVMRGIPAIIEARTKSLESFSKKAIRPGKHYIDPMREVSDLTGLRLITRTISDVGAIETLIKEQFDIDTRTVNKKEELDHDRFGYTSLHMIIKPKPPRVTTPEWASFEGMLAEIQIRTYSQHAWANIQRALEYTKEDDIPTPIRRRLYRLSALFELADDELQGIWDAVHSLHKTYSDAIRTNESGTELNGDSLRIFIEESTVVDEIVRYIQSLGVNISGPGAVSRDVDMAKRAGIQTIGALEKMFVDIKPWVEEFLKDYYFSAHADAVRQGCLWTDRNGIVTMALIASFPDVFTPEVLEGEYGWGLPQQIIASAQRIRPASVSAAGPLKFH